MDGTDLQKKLFQRKLACEVRLLFRAAGSYNSSRLVKQVQEKESVSLTTLQIKIKLGKQLSEEAENAPSRLSG